MITRENQPASPLAKLPFQDFLADQGLMVRDNQDPRNWQLVPGRQKRHNSEKLWSILIKTPGYLVPGEVTAAHLYGSSSTVDLDNAFSVGKYLKGVIQEQDSLLTRRIGQGLGVKSLYPSNEEALEVLFNLWENTNRFVSAKVLADRLYPYEHPAKVKNVRSRTNELIQRVHFDSAEIQSASFNEERYYRLRVLSEETPQPEVELIRRTEVIYQKDFQRWLSNAGVIKKYPERTGKIQVKEGEFLTEKEKRVCRLLMRHSERIVPVRTAANSYYGGVKPDNWQRKLRANLYVLRKKLVNPEDIFSSHSDGIWSFGIESLSLSKSLLYPLHSLWQNMDEFVPAQDIYRNHGDDRIQHLQRLKEGLKCGPFEIGSRVENDRIEYILIHEENLVRAEAP